MDEADTVAAQVQDDDALSTTSSMSFIQTEELDPGEEEEATSEMMTRSQYAQVVFHDVPDFYEDVASVLCNFILPNGAIEFESSCDRVGIFRVPYVKPGDCICFKPVVVVDGGEKGCVTFTDADSLPNDEDFYQFQYLRQDAVLGASVPFQLRAKPPNGELPKLKENYERLLKLSEDLTEQLEIKSLSLVQLKGNMAHLVQDKTLLEQNLDESRESIGELRKERDLWIGRCQVMDREKQFLAKDKDRVLEELQSTKATVEAINADSKILATTRLMNDDEIKDQRLSKEGKPLKANMSFDEDEGSELTKLKEICGRLLKLSENLTEKLEIKSSALVNLEQDYSREKSQLKCNLAHLGQDKVLLEQKLGKCTETIKMLGKERDHWMGRCQAVEREKQLLVEDKDRVREQLQNAKATMAAINDESKILLMNDHLAREEKLTKELELLKGRDKSSSIEVQLEEMGTVVKSNEKFFSNKFDSLANELASLKTKPASSVALSSSLETADSLESGAKMKVVEMDQGECVTNKCKETINVLRRERDHWMRKCQAMGREKQLLAEDKDQILEQPHSTKATKIVAKEIQLRKELMKEEEKSSSLEMQLEELRTVISSNEKFFNTKFDILSNEIASLKTEASSETTTDSLESLNLLRSNFINGRISETTEMITDAADDDSKNAADVFAGEKMEGVAAARGVEVFQDGDLNIDGGSLIPILPMQTVEAMAAAAKVGVASIKKLLKNPLRSSSSQGEEKEAMGECCTVAEAESRGRKNKEVKIILTDDGKPIACPVASGEEEEEAGHLSCPVCDQQFEPGRLRELEFHVDDHMKELACPVCSVVFGLDMQKEYQDHVSMHFADENGGAPPASSSYCILDNDA